MKFENIPAYYENLKYWPEISEEDLRQVWRSYYGLISHLDAEVGKLLDYLEENGLREETVVVFTGEHGEALGRNGMFTKGFFTDPSAGVPLVISQPGTIAEGEVVDGVVSILDLAPTLLDLADIGVPENYQGDPLLSTPNEPATREAVFGEISLAGRHRVWVRTEDFAYDRNWPRNCSADAALFDMSEDPDQQTNVAGREEYSDVVDRLDDRLEQWYSETESNPDAYPFVGTKEKHC
jgi:arylsulfatase A-like enzyme